MATIIVIAIPVVVLLLAGWAIYLGRPVDLGLRVGPSQKRPKALRG